MESSGDILGARVHGLDPSGRYRVGGRGEVVESQTLESSVATTNLLEFVPSPYWFEFTVSRGQTLLLYPTQVLLVRLFIAHEDSRSVPMFRESIVDARVCTHVCACGCAEPPPPCVSNVGCVSLRSYTIPGLENVDDLRRSFRSSRGRRP